MTALEQSIIIETRPPEWGMEICWICALRLIGDELGRCAPCFEKLTQRALPRASRYWGATVRRFIPIDGDNMLTPDICVSYSDGVNVSQPVVLRDNAWCVDVHDSVSSITVQWGQAND